MCRRKDRPRKLACAAMWLLAGWQVVAAAPSFADERCDGTAACAPAAEPLHVRIDRLIAAPPDFSQVAAGPASDAEFLRRACLDLAGVIPTAGEARAFLDDPSPGKRQALIDRLLDSPDYVRHMQRAVDVLLMQRRRDKHVPAAEWQAYLRDSFAANKPWSQLISEILGADGTPEKIRAAARFYLDREAQTADLVRDIGSLFLGQNLRCAQCHDHPIVEDYLQSHFFGLAAFLDRSYLFPLPGTEQTALAEKAEGATSFTSALTGQAGATGPRLPDGTALDEPSFDEGQAYVVAPADGVRPVPKFSRREQLAPLLVAHPAFARNVANRLWVMMLGRGLVHPPDYQHSANPPSHPELLELLAQELAAMDYNLKAMLRELALSETYGRSGHLPEGVQHVPPERFAVAAVRPLSPEQLAWSLVRATGLDDATRRAIESPEQGEQQLQDQLAKQVEPIIRTFVTSLPGEPDASEATAGQALFLLNGDVLPGWLAPRPGNLVDRLLKLPNDDAVAEELYLSVLSRRPADDERQSVKDYLSAGASVDRAERIADYAWALATSAEFRFNH